MRRRVVVTGIGLVTPLSALGARETWRALMACRTGVRSLTEEDMPPVS
jgi:3-oxoacyl-(acyl-carrier-protein) synthase